MYVSPSVPLGTVRRVPASAETRKTQPRAAPECDCREGVRYPKDRERRLSAGMWIRSRQFRVADKEIEAVMGCKA